MELPHLLGYNGCSPYSNGDLVSGFAASLTPLEGGLLEQFLIALVVAIAK
jgi:hypothetical protein